MTAAEDTAALRAEVESRYFALDPEDRPGEGHIDIVMKMSPSQRDAWFAYRAGSHARNRAELLKLGIPADLADELIALAKQRGEEAGRIADEHERRERQAATQTQS